MKAYNNDKVTAMDVFKSISAIDLTARNNSRYTSHINEAIGEECRQRVMGLLPEGSLAKKIFDQMVESSRRLSEKQRWVIAYELMKVESYVAYVLKSKNGNWWDEEEDEE